MSVSSYGKGALLLAGPFFSSALSRERQSPGAPSAQSVLLFQHRDLSGDPIWLHIGLDTIPFHECPVIRQILDAQHCPEI